MTIIQYSTLLVLLSSVGSAWADSHLAVEQGCINCHGQNLRGEAPSFERLSGKLAKLKGDEAALAQFVVKYRTGEPFGHIDAHERLSPQTATALLRWLSDGAH